MKINRKFAEKLYILILFLFISVGVAGCGSISDGEYTASVTLTGGSGKAYIESPCKVTVSDDLIMADIIWSSPYYDYMIVDGERYEPVNTDGNSEFVIPVILDKSMEIQADTIAMSTPHLIDYTIRFEIIDSADKDMPESGGKGAEDYERGLGQDSILADMEPLEIPGLTYLSTDENFYADRFAIYRYEDGYTVVSVSDGRNYLVVPKDAAVPENLPEDIIVLRKNLDRIYLAASGAMCQFEAIGAAENIILSGIDKDGWYIDSAKEAMDAGTLIFGGKYNAPDYEMMVQENVNLAIENTMILHTPKVQEKLEQLGIPVFIDRSSYEEEPLGRCEWVKVYGVFADREEEADEAFDEQKAMVDALSEMDMSGKTVVIFALNSNHQIVTRRKTDYYARMVEMAGGIYLAPNIDDNDSSSGKMVISTESFYDYAADADIIIYNSTIEDAPKSLSDFMNMDTTFSGLKAAGTGNIWYTDKSLYQYADKTGTIIDNLYKIISEEKDETEFFHKLK